MAVSSLYEEASDVGNLGTNTAEEINSRQEKETLLPVSTLSLKEHHSPPTYLGSEILV